MSEKRDTEASLLPDDAEKKISELLEALRESEEQMMEGTPAEDAATSDPESELEPGNAMADSGAEDFLSDEESDYVDLDAELLDNSTDMLQLDEDDSIEEPLPEEMDEPLQLEFGADEPMSADESSVDPFRAAYFNQPQLSEQQADSLVVPRPARPRDALPVWFSPMLAFIALIVSGVALWFTLNTPAPATVSSTAPGDERALESLKVDVASLRERLSAVEAQADEGKEAVLVLERVQQLLARMETNNIDSELSAEAEPVAELPAMVVAKPMPMAPKPVPEKVEKPEVVVTAPIGGAVAASQESGNKPVSAPGKVYIQGWAVNLRSYYYKVDAERLLRRYAKAGIAAEIREIPKGSATWYRVRVKGFASKKEADAFIEGLTDEQGRALAWPSYYQGYVDS